MDTTDSGFEDSSAPAKPSLRSFVTQASKQDSFYMKIGSIAAGAVILSLLGATGVMYYKDRQARATVPIAPPVDAIISPLHKPDVDQVAMAPTEGASAPMGAASVPTLVAPSSVVSVSNSDEILQLKSETSISIDALIERIDAMQKQVDGVQEVVASLQKKVNAQAIRLRSIASNAIEEVTEMKVTKISPDSVDVMIGPKKYTVASGGKLPGGATYIGFDVAKSTMRTDRGDFVIN
jgi:hypothetical protein